MTLRSLSGPAAPTALAPTLPVAPVSVASAGMVAHLRDYLRTSLGSRYAGLRLIVAAAPNDKPGIYIRWMDGPSCVAMDAMLVAFKLLYGDITPPRLRLSLTQFRRRKIPLRASGLIVTLHLHRSYSPAFLRECAAAVAEGDELPAAVLGEDGYAGRYRPAHWSRRDADDYGSRAVAERLATNHAIQADGPDVPAVALARRRSPGAPRRRPADPMGSAVGESALAAELRANGVTE